MKLDIDALSKGERRKLGALVKSVGPELGQDCMARWLLQRGERGGASEPVDKNANAIIDALGPMVESRAINLGMHGYSIRRGRKGANGTGSIVLVTKNTAK